MNYDLAIMALEGLARTPLTVRTEGGEWTVEGSPAAFKELARLCLLLGGVQSAEDAFELTPGVHVSDGSPMVRLQLRNAVTQERRSAGAQERRCAVTQ